ncbi:conserved hypothetical protein [Candidatus Terasakiella magnetica]|uniref:Uncharacterized protein n=1 Tax=Candidatus Terasakiella magnetica TaxID=1867952 RepID=A0A1C3REU1_9PROT|nr:hypothetical protein [Candidatus Terasakiella magnetica]SCA55800.1 conserved hypothetical protein [Candidatus Terasakiella magnetica]
MSAQHIERNRLKLQMDKSLREVNRDVINPDIPELTLKKIEPIFKLVARARAAYLKELFEVTKICGDDLPSAEQVKQLNHYREAFEELRHASQALDTAIEQGYLDVTS